MGWITSISNEINEVFNSTRSPLATIPPLLLICGLKQRSGLSATALTSSIISRLPEAGIETGVNPDGSANIINKFVRIMCEEIINELHDNARVDGVIENNTVVSVGTGANAGGPVVVQSTNILPSSISGVLR